jgi:hypothetical protein
MKGSTYIVAVNKDREAPIFSVANLGIAGDVRTVLPALIAALRAELLMRARARRSASVFLDPLPGA